MKEFFSKTLNIVTVCCLLVWVAMLVITAALFPQLMEKVFTMSEKLIDLVIGSLIGAGGVKVKQIIDSKQAQQEPSDPLILNGESDGYID